MLHIGRPQAELPVEFGAEVGRAVEADAIGDLRQRAGVMGAVEQHVVAPLSRRFQIQFETDIPSSLKRA